MVSDTHSNINITLKGYIVSRKGLKVIKMGFIDLSDGTCFEHLQVIYDDSLSFFDELSKIKIGSAVTIEGILVESPGIFSD